VATKEALDSSEEQQTEGKGQTGDQQTDEDDVSEGDEESRETEGQEVDVVLSDDDGSQPKPQNFGIRKRINKLNSRVAAADGRATDAEAQLEVEKAQNKLLKLALDQQHAKPEEALPPDPTDFDDGAKDPGYVSALQAYNQRFFDEQFAKRAKETAAPPSVSPNSERRQVAHYEAAEKLGVKDYDEVEDAAIGVLGQDTVKRLIDASDASPRILYYLGKNKEVAAEIAELVKTDPVAGVLKLGALGASLKVQPRRQSQVAPDPDDELSGTVSRKSAKRGPAGATYT